MSYHIRQHGRIYAAYSDLKGVNPRWDNLLAGWKLDEESDGSGAVPRADVLGTYELTDNYTTASAAGLISNGADLVKADVTYLNNTNGPSAQNVDTGYFIVLSFKPASSTTHYVHKGVYGGGDATYFVVNASNKPVFYYYGGSNISISHPTSVSIGSWNMLFGWWDPADGKAYIQLNDGAATWSAGTSTVLTGALSNFILGSNDGNTADGVIDECYVFSEPKNSDWRTDFYNSGAGRSYPD